MYNIRPYLFLICLHTLATPLLYTKEPIFYSQDGQDRFLYEKYFKKMDKPGIFVEVGAYDGKTYSNTLLLEEYLGWHGLCIEPLAAAYKQLIQNRKCICIHGCIGLHSGTRKFLEITGAPQMLSGFVDTYDPRHLQRIMLELKRDGGNCKEIIVPVFNLTELLFSYNIDHVDYLSIDTEGSELEILKSIDFKRIRIDVLTVENNYNENCIGNYLKKYNFKYTRKIGGDEVYVNISGKNTRTI